MTNFYLMIVMQCIIVGLSLYSYLRLGWFTIKSKTWSERICNFCAMHVFMVAILLILIYWYDSIETNNTLFSQPIHKTIEMIVK